MEEQVEEGEGEQIPGELLLGTGDWWMKYCF